jgi:hypothetical protein
LARWRVRGKHRQRRSRVARIAEDRPLLGVDRTVFRLAAVEGFSRHSLPKDKREPWWRPQGSEPVPEIPPWRVHRCLMTLAMKSSGGVVPGDGDGLCHLPDPGDRWPSKVDTIAVACYARAFADLTLALTAH